MKRRRREILKTLLFVRILCERDHVFAIVIQSISNSFTPIRAHLEEREKKRGKGSPFCVLDIKSEVLERLRSGIHISYGSRRIRSREREKERKTRRDETGRVVHGASETRPSIFQIVASEHSADRLSSLNVRGERRPHRRRVSLYKEKSLARVSRKKVSLARSLACTLSEREFAGSALFALCAPTFSLSARAPLRSPRLIRRDYEQPRGDH